MACSDVSTLHVVHSLILTTYEMGAVYSPFTDKLTEVQTDELTCLRSCNLNPEDLRPGILNLRTTDI